MNPSVISFLILDQHSGRGAGSWWVLTLARPGWHHALMDSCTMLAPLLHGAQL